MGTHFRPCLAFGLALGLAGPAHSSSKPGQVGARVGEFVLRDHRGLVRRLSDWRDRKLVVVVFLGVDCPLAKLYAPRLAELHREFSPRSVAFVAVDPNRHESPADLARYVRQHRLPFPLLRDVGHAVADSFGARRSPEAFVLDQDRAIRYRGRVDDQYAVTVRRARPSRRDLAVALEELLAGKPVSIPVTSAGGCPISRAPRAKTPPSVTYCRDVAGILQRRCQVCHRPGSVAPFALTTYAEASAWAQAVREVVDEGRMPPWGADPRHGKFANDPSLSPAEKRTLLAWVDSGCPEGERTDLPAPAKFPDGWAIGEPDLVVSMPEPFTVPAQGVIEYQYFAVDPGFTEDRWVQAAEIRPGNKAVVHHCNVFLQPPGRSDPEDLAEQGALGSYCLTMTAPGTPPLTLPPGLAKRIPAGWRIVFVVHYTAVGSVQKDQTRLGLKFADPKGVKKEVATKLMYDLDLAIPPRAAHHQVSQTWQVNADVLLLSLFPHMHLRGKSFRYVATYPDGTEEVLLDVPRWDFNWQFRYVLAEPKRLPAGTRLTCTAVYDNSADNPANPNPDVTVRAGTQSWEEMFNGYFDVCLADEDRTREDGWARALWRAAQSVCRPGVSLLLCLVGGVYLCRRRVGRRLGRSNPTASSPPGRQP
jgi:peroxiredoxin